ncbi:hypothetical protein ACQR0Z_21305 [Bradyrhizobium sp. HKCCYLS3077]|uniref:hypothetical protein n=1 Tax=Bradyrhizobium sp. HKCCYLS3077 TaxID=3420761 RepID=UPI003EB9FCCC
MTLTTHSSQAAVEGIVSGRSAPARVAALKPVIRFSLLFALVWLIGYAAHVTLPFLRAGSVVIADAKFDTLVARPMFEPSDRFRVMFFGHSKALTCIRPQELDSAMGRGFRSYNLGLPGEVRFMPMLEAALQAGNVPTHVVLTLPWDGKPVAEGLIERLRNDSAIVNALIPFRTLPRDATLFLYENRHRLAAALHDVAEQRQGMLDQRGWYFIKSQSHYADDRLPDSYTLPTDTPARVERRQIPDRAHTRERLEQLARQYGFQILFIPVPYRLGHYAPPQDVDRIAGIADHPSIRIIGPDYFLYPPRMFSDPQHMNLSGALAYTSDLAALLKRSGAFD